MSHKFDLDIHSVRKLAEVLKDTGLSEIEYVEGDKRIKVACCATPAAAAPLVQAQTPAVVLPSATEPVSPEIKGDPLKSPMVGTVYLSSAPGTAPFVKIGDTVKTGDTLLIIEAMKVMNPIKATRGGVIADIIVKDATPVEFGETLLIIS